MANIWIVVAESSRARIFVADHPLRAPREVDDLAHLPSRLHDRDLTTDRPGRSFDSIGQGRHAMEQNQDPKRHEIETFAKQIDHHLEVARLQGAFDKLVLVAPPAFLGLLRANLDAATAKLITHEIAKNLIALSADELHAYLSNPA